MQANDIIVVGAILALGFLTNVLLPSSPGAEARLPLGAGITGLPTIGYPASDLSPEKFIPPPWLVSP